MADMAEEKAPIDSVPNIRATNLRYGTINKMAMELCITGTLYNWKHVADQLGFSNFEINGHFANFDGCKPAENMLNEWIFKRGGKILELVKVFETLDLQSCLQELLVDEDLQEAIKFFKNRKDDDDDDNVSSGTESISEDSSFPPSTSNDTMTTCSLVSSDNLSLEKLSLQQKCEHKITKKEKDTEVFQKKDNDLKAKSVENVHRVSTSVITFSDWPEPGVKPDLLRCNSEPGVPEKNKIKGKKPFFSRSFSVESGKKKHKEKKTKNKISHRLSKLILSKNKKRSHSTSEVVEVQGHYREDKPKESTNLSPLKEAEIQDSIDGPVSCQRPVSSSSEDSLPFSPSSPNSLGYESGPECEVSENKNKRIYIICNPAETKIFGKAYDLYQCFCKKGYQCNMFALNFNEVLEIGMYRYEMEQFTKADYLFLCVSEELKRIFEESTKDMKIKDDNSKSLRHVSDFMMSFLAMRCCNKNGKIMPILLAEDSRSHIPLFLGNYFSYEWPEQEARMENTIHRRPEFSIPVSNLIEQAPQKVFGLKAA